MARLVILTGGRAVGKSTVCRRTVALAHERGYTCRGIITLTDLGARNVVDVGSGRCRRLTSASDDGQAVVQGRFRFDPQTLSWGARILSRESPCDLLVIDELGPLEVERGEGWVTAFDRLRSRVYQLALVVVRPELLPQVQDRTDYLAPHVRTVTRENRDRLPASLIGMVEQRT